MEDFVSLSGVALFQTEQSVLDWPLEGVRFWKLSRTYPDEESPSLSVLMQGCCFTTHNPTRHLLAISNIPFGMGVLYEGQMTLSVSPAQGLHRHFSKITVIPSVIFPPLSFSPLLKNFWKKILSVVISPPEFKHIMFKNYVFCYIILIKLNKIFKIIFQKIFCWPLSFSPLTKICKIVTFWGENDKGYYGN